ncbi:hypothetical protein VNO80_25788 [Phaseolus coccineus]|uniref:Aconitase/3-isopropylmalate dehydratase large subunit alpha/beta/alpha domain-containing protein n=1 Tax=Phaseolus coccineus TaxID=3886 RepID=A0AAN9LZZ3_PHACN
MLLLGLLSGVIVSVYLTFFFFTLFFLYTFLLILSLIIQFKWMLQGLKMQCRPIMELEFQRNKEGFAFLKWGSTAFPNMLVVPPGSGIVHQVNLEYLEGLYSTMRAYSILTVWRCHVGELFAGAAQSLGAGAILVNPWNVTEVAAAIARALKMPSAEREKRHKHNFLHVTSHTAQEWAGTFVSELNDTVIEAQLRTRQVPPQLPTKAAIESYQQSTNRLLILVYARHTKKCPEDKKTAGTLEIAVKLYCTLFSFGWILAPFRSLCTTKVKDYDWEAVGGERPILNGTTCVVELQLETWMDEIQRQKGQRKSKRETQKFYGRSWNVELGLTSICPGRKFQIIKGEAHTNGNARTPLPEMPPFSVKFWNWVSSSIRYNIDRSSLQSFGVWQGSLILDHSYWLLLLLDGSNAILMGLSGTLRVLLLVVGFSGTLTEPVEKTGDQIKEMELKVHPKLRQPLTALCSDPNTTVVVLSGSGRQVLNDVMLGKMLLFG